MEQESLPQDIQDAIRVSSQASEIFVDNDPRNYFKKNRALIGTRWPHIWDAIKECDKGLDKVEKINSPHQSMKFNNLHISSSYDRKEEADLQISLVGITQEAAGVTLYG